MTTSDPHDSDTYVTKTGRVLTDADIQALADEAERGYDVSPEPVLAPNGRYVADDENADLYRFDMDDDEWYGRSEW